MHPYNHQTIASSTYKDCLPSVRSARKDGEMSVRSFKRSATRGNFGGRPAFAGKQTAHHFLYYSDQARQICSSLSRTTGSCQLPAAQG